eukprot:TRINITY_DN14982_c0_g1_i1.p1 TRINITY_DN14982_c0_g1~~TRINITY_DN14982_c0_g1_i1.p1  ORF type:complete len:134 (+),score=7.09 TRINITY_DN14982_c0_g1_i1:61-462(+)
MRIYSKRYVEGGEQNPRPETLNAKRRGKIVSVAVRRDCTKECLFLVVWYAEKVMNYMKTVPVVLYKPTAEENTAPTITSFFFLSKEFQTASATSFGETAIALPIVSFVICRTLSASFPKNCARSRKSLLIIPG